MKKTNIQTSRQDLEAKYNNSRINLLLVVAFTAINIILLVTKSDSYFLFSAYIPYALVTLGMLICGMFPQEFYVNEFDGMEFFDTSVFAVFLVIAIIIVALYLISWFLSRKNKRGWLIFALILFTVDTLGMFAFQGLALDSIIDIVFHVWVIVSLCQGISASGKLKKMPMDETVLPQAEVTEDNTPEVSEKSDI
jgi:hypothetical protein